MHLIVHFYIRKKKMFENDIVFFGNASYIDCRRLNRSILRYVCYFRTSGGHINDILPQVGSLEISKLSHVLPVSLKYVRR